MSHCIGDDDVVLLGVTSFTLCGHSIVDSIAWKVMLYRVTIFSWIAFSCNWRSASKSMVFKTGMEMEFRRLLPKLPLEPGSASAALASSPSLSPSSADESPDLETPFFLQLKVSKSKDPSAGNATHWDSSSLAGIFMYKLFPVFLRPSNELPLLVLPLDLGKVSSFSSASSSTWAVFAAALSSLSALSIL